MELKERILSEAFQMFMKSGIRSVTMDQISNYMGISKRTLYEIFREKNELLREGIEYFSNIRRAEARHIIETSGNVIEAIYILITKGEEMRQQINPMFFEDIRKYLPEIHHHITTEGRMREYSFTLEVLKKGVREGIFKGDLDLEMVNAFIHQMMNIVLQEDVFPKDQYSHEDIFKNIMMPYLSGISTEKGKEQILKYFEKEIR